VVGSETVGGEDSGLVGKVGFARSGGGVSGLPWDRALRGRWGRIKGELGDL